MNNKIIREFMPDEKEYMNLSKAAELLTAKSTKGIRYTVIATYFDFGLDWKWTTLCATRPDGVDYQALNPRDHELIITAEDVENAVDTIRADKYWTDK